MLSQRRKGQRIAGEERERLRRRFAEAYGKGKSIRDLATENNVSIGLSRNLLVESGVQLRSRGGATRGKSR